MTMVCQFLQNAISEFHSVGNFSILMCFVASFCRCFYKEQESWTACSLCLKYLFITQTRASAPYKMGESDFKGR